MFWEKYFLFFFLEKYFLKVYFNTFSYALDSVIMCATFVKLGMKKIKQYLQKLSEKERQVYRRLIIRSGVGHLAQWYTDCLASVSPEL